MATLNLTALFINLMATGASVSAQSAPDRTEAYSVPGEVRTYVGGRRRSINAVGELGTYEFTLRLASRTSIDTLRTWAGQTVQVRDNKGRRFFGVFYELSVREYKTESTYDVGMKLTVVTATEAV